MSRRAKYSGAAGTVVDGRIRDLQEHRQLGFGVFAKGTGTTAPSEIARVRSINVPVRFNSSLQDSWVHPGDYIIVWSKYHHSRLTSRGTLMVLWPYHEE